MRGISGMYHKGWIGRTVQALFIVGCSFILFWYMNIGIEFESNVGNLIVYAFSYTFPLVFVVGLYGMRSGMLSYLLVLMPTLFFSTSDTFLLTYHLVLVYVVAFVVEKGFLRSIVKTLISGIISGFILHWVFYFVNYLVYSRDFSDMVGWISVTDMVDSSAMIIVAYLILYLIFRFTPEWISQLFNVGNFRYHIKNDFYKAMKEHQPRHMLVNQISKLLTLEAVVLGFLAVLVVNSLIPDLGQVVETREGGVSVSGAAAMTPMEYDSDGKPLYKPGMGDTGNIAADEINHLEHRVENIINRTRLGAFSNKEGEGYIFVLNSEGVAFDIKLILFLLDVIMPVVQLIIFLIQRRTVRPVADMGYFLDAFASESIDDREKAANAITEIRVNTKDEIQMLHESLTNTVNEVIDYIQRQQEEQQLKEDLRVAQKASEAKSAFLSNVSHEIRTPINAILGMDEMILRESADKDVRKYATNIQNSGRTLVSLVNDILDFSRIEAGKLEIIPVEYEMSSTLNDLVNMISVKAEEKGLTLNVDVNRQLPHLLIGDEVRVKQCVINILNNAVKYTEKGSVTMTVGYEKRDEKHADIRFEVSDTGIGMKKEDLDRLYTPFERIDEKRNRTIEGTGLGMSIVKQLLDMMGASLEVESVYGEGSKFGFTITQEVISWEPMGDFADMYERSLESADEYETLFQAPDARILVVDDTQMNLTVVRGLLEPTRMKIDTALSGYDAIKRVKNNSYDLIFLDQRMPGMDGIETLTAMKELPEEGMGPAGETNLSYHAPCVALTANAISGARERFIQAGFDDYLTKPIDSKKLECLIQNMLPAEKVLHKGDAGYLTDEALAVQIAAARGPGDKTLKKYAEIDVIDYETAIKNCLREDILREAVRDFTMSAKTGPDEIETLLEEGDIRNYTVKVHALKSSARLIGAMELSKQAADLEASGDAGDIDTIRKKTPALLRDYRSLGEILIQIDDESRTRTDSRPEIDIDSLHEAFMGIREYTEAFDFDSVDSIIDTLDGYRMPDEESERYERIRDMAMKLDHDGLLAELEKDNS